MKRWAYTLAEILIVVGVIGIVAEMTMPTLVQNVNYQAYKTGYKKAYSMINQAVMRAGTDGTLTIPCANGNVCNNANFNAMKAYFNVKKDCNSGANIANCWTSGELTWASNGWASPWGTGAPSNTSIGFIDTSGMAWSTLDGAGYVQFLVDTNGIKGPNKYGKDRAVFALDLQNASNIIRVGYLGDYTSNTSSCPNGSVANPCYYTSWVSGDK